MDRLKRRYYEKDSLVKVNWDDKSDVQPAKFLVVSFAGFVFLKEEGSDPIVFTSVNKTQEAGLIINQQSSAREVILEKEW